MGILDMLRLDGKVALVSGCKRGIGRGLALALADAGADIIGVSATLEPGSEVEREIRGMGRSFAAYRCDFSQRHQTLEFADRVTREHPVIDILFGNAGAISRKPAAEHSDDLWDRIVEVNLASHFVLAREVGKGMLSRGHGKIVFTASLMTFHGGMHIPSYTASKGGIGQLTKALANEWAGKGVNVNAIAPGYIATEINPELRADPQTNKFILDRIPAGRWGLPEDMAGAAVFLASDASAYVHGVVFPVDGGWLGR
jgi:2-dehydro-3-deoxy-D-gluconate 5-dehydrogenase